jgi:hypothetical protein
MNEYLKERELWWPVSPELLAGYKDGSHVKDINGSLVWYKNGLLHRDGDLPAFISSGGTLGWYKNGKYHRDGDKPAWIWPNGTLVWLKNGDWHRTTGPAIIYPNNKKEYWVNDIEITKKVESWLKTRQYTYPFTPEQQVEFTLTFS